MRVKASSVLCPGLLGLTFAAAATPAGLAAQQEEKKLSDGWVIYNYEWGTPTQNGWTGASSHARVQLLVCGDDLMVARTLEPEKFGSLWTYWYEGKSYHVPAHARGPAPAVLPFKGSINVWSSLPRSNPGPKNKAGDYSTEVRAGRPLGCSGDAVRVASLRTLLGPEAEERDIEVYLNNIYLWHDTRVPPPRDHVAEAWIRSQQNIPESPEEELARWAAQVDGGRVQRSTAAEDRAQHQRREREARAREEERRRRNNVGALAVDRSNGFAYGFAYDYPTRAAAEARALRECEKRGGNCSTALVWQGAGCGAYRTVTGNVGSAYGWGTGPTRERADAIASAEARKRSNGRPTPNHVWACNSLETGGVATLFDAAPPANCLIQFSADMDRGDEWVARVVSPFYRLSGADCPTFKSAYGAFGYGDFYSPRHQAERYADYQAEDPTGLWRVYGEQFWNWRRRKTPPIPGATWRPYVSVDVKHDTPDNVDYARRTVGRHETHFSTVCVGFKPKDFQPLATLYAENCGSWLH